MLYHRRYSVAIHATPLDGRNQSMLRANAHTYEQDRWQYDGVSYSYPARGYDRLEDWKEHT